MHDTLARLRELFSFSKRERPGIILLCLLLVLTAALPLIFHGGPARPDPLLLVRADSFANQPEHDRVERGPGGFPARRSVSLSWFDPNTLTYSEWEKLGLQERTIRVILHYREKGGLFRKPEDLGRIWGLPPAEYERLKPYVRIASAKAVALPYRERPSPSPVMHNDTSTRRISFTSRRDRSYAPLEVNQADSLQWLALPGIGEKLTSRILRFRERLGGFCSVDQVAETWGLPDSTFKKIRPMLSLAGPVTRKIPLNSAPEDILQQHPYIRFKLARVIIRYRQEHGPFASVSDLRRISLVTDELFARLEPYCSVN
jgi:competence protein ComEA